MTEETAQAASEEAAPTNGVVEYLQQNSDEIVENLGQYSYLVGDSLLFIALGMLVVFIMHKLAVRFLFSRVGNKRFLRVTIVTLYLMVLVLTGIMVLKKVGFDVSMGGPLAMLTVLFLAVIAYFLVPFLPKLPFMPGHTIEAQGIFGSVDSISSFNTAIRKFDGTMAFVPNAMLLASRILNYSYTPHRRVEMIVNVALDCDMPAVRERLMALLADHGSVLEDPEPAVHVSNATSSGAEMTLYAWVENADFLGVRTDLWLELLQMSKSEEGIDLALPRQEVQLKEAA